MVSQPVPNSGLAVPLPESNGSVPRRARRMRVHRAPGPERLGLNAGERGRVGGSWDDANRRHTRVERG